MLRFITSTLRQPSSLATSIRTFKSHNNLNNGNVGNNVVGAYAQLRDILNESKVRDVVRSQLRHERTHDKKRRIKKQRLFDDYLGFMKKKVELAYDLKKKTEQENADSERI